MLLYRPVSLNELRLICQAEMRAFPPRLPEQPIFYSSRWRAEGEAHPVLNEPYAIKIARDWNTKSETHAGYVTRFSVDDAYASKFPRRVVGSREHEELWVPSEGLEEFNAHLEGPIQVIGAFFGEGFLGEVPQNGALRGKNAREQLVALAGMVASGGSDLADEIEANYQAVLLNFFFWQQLDLAAEGIDVEERDRVLDVVQQSWAGSARRGIPLGVQHAGAG